MHKYSLLCTLRLLPQPGSASWPRGWGLSQLQGLLMVKNLLKVGSGGSNTCKDTKFRKFGPNMELWAKKEGAT